MTRWHWQNTKVKIGTALGVVAMMGGMVTTGVRQGWLVLPTTAAVAEAAWADGQHKPLVERIEVLERATAERLHLIEVRTLDNQRELDKRQARLEAVENAVVEMRQMSRQFAEQTGTLRSIDRRLSRMEDRQ